MIKRRDYRLLHPVEDGGASSTSSSAASSESSDIESEADSERDPGSDLTDSPVVGLSRPAAAARGKERVRRESGSSDSDGDGEEEDGSDFADVEEASGSSSDEEEEDLRYRRTKNLSHAVNNEKKKRSVWAEAVGDAESEKGRESVGEFRSLVDVGRRAAVVKCRICPSVVCLSEKDMDAHLNSKKHLKRMKLLGEKKLKPILDSDGEVEEEEGETHAERLARIKAMVASEADAVKEQKGEKEQQERQGKKRRRKPRKRRNKKAKDGASCEAVQEGQFENGPSEGKGKLEKKQKDGKDKDKRRNKKAKDGASCEAVQEGQFENGPSEGKGKLEKKQKDRKDKDRSQSLLRKKKSDQKENR